MVPRTPVILQSRRVTIPLGHERFHTQLLEIVLLEECKTKLKSEKVIFPLFWHLLTPNLKNGLYLAHIFNRLQEIENSNWYQQCYLMLFD